MESTFKILSEINVNAKTEKKQNLTYLSWSFAWSETKKKFPEATYKIKTFEGGKPYLFDELTGYMCFTEVTIKGQTHEMWLPVMDGANKAMTRQPYKYAVKDWNASRQQNKEVFKEKTVEAATMFDINKTIMRCLVKNLAMFGMGIYIYAGEDLPEVEPVKPKLDNERFNNALKAIEEKKTTVQKLVDTFDLDDTQLKQLKK